MNELILINNFINGVYRAPIEERYLETELPATGQVYARVAESSVSDLELAIEAASKAFPIWSEMSIDSRSRKLIRLSELIEENLEELAIAESMDTGKPLKLAKEVDIPRAAANFRFFASSIVNSNSESHIAEGEALNYTRRGPIGIVGCISPWNLPLYLFSWKIAPALATGNCIIGKPSELTPYTASLLGKLTVEAGIPPGVINILQGRGQEIGQAIVEHPQVRAISFTGGTATGKRIGQLAADQIKKVSLELGGKNPVVVFDDCDLSEAVETSVRSAFTNQGEICLCGSRILIQRGIYDDFKNRFIEKVQKLKVGLPEEDVDMGALISEGHLKKVEGFVERAKQQGATVLSGGHRVFPGSGYFFEPTIIEGLDAYCEINQQEVFGPVVTLIPFDEDRDAINKANATAYGLAAVIWTTDLRRAHQVAHQIKAGIVWVNCWMLRDLRTPFGGMKQSGIGREGGDDALRFFTEPQNICIKL